MCQGRSQDILQILFSFLSSVVPVKVNFVAAIILLALKFGLLGNLINPYLRINAFVFCKYSTRRAKKKTICSGTQPLQRYTVYDNL